MKKLILKTVLITVGAIILAFGVLYGIFALAFPKSLANFYDGLGDDKKAVQYMDRAYSQSGDVSDLDALCNFALKTGDNGLICEHLSRLFSSEEFKTYCECGTKGIAYYDFMASKYITALYDTSSDKEGVIDTASSLTDDYRTACGLYTVLRLTLQEDIPDATLINLVKEKINSAYSSYSADGQSLATADLEKLASFGY